MTRRSINPGILDLIGAIYDCVIEPALWDETVAAMQRHLGMINAILGANAMHAGRGVASLQVVSGVPERYSSMMLRYEPEVMELWGGAENVARLPLGVPFVQSHITDRAGWGENPYVRAFVAPQGIIDAVAVGLARDSTMIATLSFGRHESMGPIGAKEIADLRLLAPHVRRATTITGVLDQSMSRARSFAAALEVSPAGIVLVDADLRIIHVNGVAEAMLVAGDPIYQLRGVLAMRQPLAPRQLELAVAAAGDGNDGRRGVGIPSRRLDGRPCVLHVLPLQPQSVRTGIADAASAAIFVAEAPALPSPPGEVLAQLYGLTPAETRVFELIVQGNTPAQVARQLGKSVHTVRTHLNRVFDKTGSHRQADLMRLVGTAKLSI